MQVRFDRKNHEFRPITVETGLVNEAEGSCKWTSGSAARQSKTIVLASVHGPAVPKYLRHEDFRGLSVDVEYSTGLGGGQGGGDPSAAPSSSSSEQQRAERLGEKIIKSCILGCVDAKAFPRMLLCLRVAVIEDDGGALPCAVNACITALASAGVPMLHMPLAVSIVNQTQVSAGGESAMDQGSDSDSDKNNGNGKSKVILSLLDPVREEELESESRFLLVLRPSMRGEGGADKEEEDMEEDEGEEGGQFRPRVLYQDCAGSFSPQQLGQALEAGAQAVQQLLRVVRGALAE